MRTLLALAVPAIIALSLFHQGAAVSRQPVGMAALPPGQESAALALLGMGFVFIVALRWVRAR